MNKTVHPNEILVKPHNQTLLREEAKKLGKAHVAALDEQIARQQSMGI